ncbi:MAG: radical SAM protein [Bacteroidia bacterium]
MRLIRKPVLCNYYVTYRCNAQCSFCDIWEKPSPYITEENVRENLRDLKKMGVKVIDFTGGEPLLHRDLHVFLSIAREMGFITTVTTNALLYPKYGERLRGLIDMLHFSLDSPIREEHNASRGVACFDHVMESLELAKSWGERPDILFTVSSENVQQIKQVYEEISLPRNLMLILNPLFEYNDHGANLAQAALDELEAWGKKRLVYINNGFIDLRRDGGNHIDKPVCKAASSTVVITPENKLILPCYHLGEKELPIEGRLYELYYSDEAEEIKKLEGKLPGCEGCVINCYMQPSFAVEVNKYWFSALPSTLKYNWEKGTWKTLVSS